MDFFTGRATYLDQAPSHSTLGTVARARFSNHVAPTTAWQASIQARPPGAQRSPPSTISSRVHLLAMNSARRISRRYARRGHFRGCPGNSADHDFIRVFEMRSTSLRLLAGAAMRRPLPPLQPRLPPCCHSVTANWVKLRLG